MFVSCRMNNDCVCFGMKKSKCNYCITAFIYLISCSATWSDNGLTTTKDTSPNGGNITICQSSHLTSFAVMVDVQGTKPQVK